MGEVIPVERPLDKEIKIIRERQKITQERIEELEKIKEEHLAALKDPAVANAEFIEQIKSEIAEINDAINRGKKAIRRDEISISEILERMENLKISKNTEIKIK